MKNPFKNHPYLTRNILILSGVSLLTDVASEMLYPVLPLYLKQIGYSFIAIGLIEGIADAVAGLSKGYFGYLSDKTGNRNGFVQAGYGLAAISKPLMGLTTSIGVIFSARFLDRFSKGIRTAPRDAILANESTKQNRGKVFGFHRSADTLGATLGPLISLVFLFYFPAQYQQLFLWVLLPGLGAFALTLMLRSKKTTPTTPRRVYGFKDFKGFWGNATPTYRRLIIGFILLALLNSSDMFLLLRVKEMGLSDVWVIGAYIFYNLILMLSAFPMGYMSDRFGYKQTFLIGLGVFSLVYAAFAQELSLAWVFVIFGVYGIFTAAHEAVAKAWLSTQLDDTNQGTGLGLYMTLSSLAFLVASLFIGAVWQFMGGNTAFALISLLSLGVVGYFAFTKFQTLQEDEAAQQA